MLFLSPYILIIYYHNFSFLLLEFKISVCLSGAIFYQLKKNCPFTLHILYITNYNNITCFLAHPVLMKKILHYQYLIIINHWHIFLITYFPTFLLSCCVGIQRCKENISFLITEKVFMGECESGFDTSCNYFVISDGVG